MNDEQMIWKVYLNLNESTNPLRTGYHLTQLKNLDDIIINNEFVLQDHHKAPDLVKNGYYMAYARSPRSTFFINSVYSKKGSVAIIELDIPKFANNYKIIPYDWGVEYDEETKKPKRSYRDELEERILSKNKIIPNAMSYIKRIHILTHLPQEESESIPHNYNLKTFEYAPVDVFLYNNQKNFLLLNTNKAKLLN
jgi:signal peptidase I